MAIESERVIAYGNIIAAYSSSEIAIGLVQSYKTKRKTVYLSMVNFAKILRHIEDQNGCLPELTVGWTGQKMAKFLGKRFSVDVKAVPREGAVGYIYQVIGKTETIKYQIGNYVNEKHLERILRNQ